MKKTPKKTSNLQQLKQELILWYEHQTIIQQNFFLKFLSDRNEKI